MNNANSLVSYYEEEIRGLRREKLPGQVRAKKGNLVAVLAQGVVRLVWRELNYPENALTFQSKYKVELKIDEGYVKKLEEEIRMDILKNLDNYKYKINIDVPVFYKKMRLTYLTPPPFKSSKNQEPKNQEL